MRIFNVTLKQNNT